ncbi:MAG: FkbM family methyltransferase [Azospirillaceae bacterium]|nr:FkbM family methyltransferase [Azospirillaceae bacterium]
MKSVKKTKMTTGDDEASPQKSLIDVAQIDIPGGVTILFPDDLSLMTPYVLLEQGDWFEDEISFVRCMVERGTDAIDIGANYGIYTLTLAKLSGPDGRVWAFEPTSRTADYLDRSLVVNGLANVELIRAALSDHDGEARLTTFVNSELNTLRGSGTTTGETVRLETLDGCRTRWRGRDIAFVKIDAEGEDANVIRGGERFFCEQSPLVMFEIKQDDVVNFDLVERFRERGYEIFRLVPGLGVLEPFLRSGVVDPFQLNLFAAKPDRAKVLAARGLLVRTAEPLPPQPGLRSGLWDEQVVTQTWAANLWPLWQHGRLGDGSAGWGIHRDALNAFAQSRRSDLPPGQRLAMLRFAFDRIGAAVENAATVPRLFSLVRIATVLGERGRAVEVLSHLEVLLEAGDAIVLDEPFLPLDSRFETLVPGDRLTDWMVTSVLEALVQFGSFSSYFNFDRSRNLLAKIVRQPFHNAEAERRLKLIAFVNREHRA